MKLEKILARLLHYGSWAASIVIGLGFLLTLIDARFGTHDLARLPNMSISQIGVAMFILLPTVRVFVMLVVYLREKDYKLACTAAVVFSVLVTGFVIGVRTMGRLPG